MRRQTDPLLGEIPNTPAGIGIGGTGGSTSKEAAENLNTIPYSTINQPDGILGLLPDSSIPLEHIDPNRLNIKDAVKGPTTVEQSTTQTYVITNYDLIKTYVVSAKGNGSVSVSEVNPSEITYTAPSQATAGGDGIIVNGRTLQIQVVAPEETYIDTPSITAPVNNAINVATEYTFIASAFHSTSPTEDHVSSTWQIASDTGFTSIVRSTTDDTSHKTSWTVQSLLPLTKYYVRVLYKGNESEPTVWSNVIAFTTKKDYPTVLTKQFHHQTGTEEIGDLFGYTVELSADGNTLAVGAPNKNNPNVDLTMFEGLSLDTVGSPGAFCRTGGYNSTYLSAYWFDATVWLGYLCVISNKSNPFIDSGIDPYLNGDVSFFNQYGEFVARQNQEDAYTGITTANNSIYACVWAEYTGQTVGKIQGRNQLMQMFAPIAEYTGALYKFRGITSIGNMLYICAWQGPIYKMDISQQVKTLEVFHNENLQWSGVKNIDGTLYATTWYIDNNTGAIYKFTNNQSAGKTLVSGSLSRPFVGLCYYEKDIYATATTSDKTGYTYRQVAGQGDFHLVETNLNTTWMALVPYNGDLVCVAHDNYVYIRKNPAKYVREGKYAGATYIFKKSGTNWLQQAKLVPQDSKGFDCFGDSLSLSGDGNYLAAWSARKRDLVKVDVGGGNFVWRLRYTKCPDSTGSYIFKRTGTTWEEQVDLAGLLPNYPLYHKGYVLSQYGSPINLTNSISLNNDGSIVAVVHNWAITTGPSDDPSTDPKASYISVLTRSGTTWSLRDSILITDQSVHAEQAGSSSLCIQLNLAGNVLYVGLPGYNHNGKLSSGKVDVYAFNGSAWIKSVNPILPPAGDIVDFLMFGSDMKVSSDEKVMAVASGSGGTVPGGVYIFVKNESNAWVYVRKLLIDGDKVGINGSLPNRYRLSIDGDGRTVTVSVPFKGITADNDYAGIVYVFRSISGTWSEETLPMYTLQQPTPAPGDLFGYMTQLVDDGSICYIGAPGRNLGSKDNVGQLFVFS